MKPFTKSTYGRNRYFDAPKEHKVPKSSNDRKGTRSGQRQLNRRSISQELIKG